MNNTKTFLLLAGLVALLGLAGQALGGAQGLMLGLILGGIMSFGSYFFSDKIVLRMYKAQVVTEAQAPELYGMVRRLAQRAELPMPTVAITPAQQPNAFATGRSPAKAVVAVTQGLLQTLNQEELEGVIAHELAHIKNRDMLISTVAAVIAGAISNIPYLLMFGGGRDDEDAHPFARLALMLLAPLAAVVLQMAISRQREFEADRVGALIAGKPRGLSTALRKLDAIAHQVPMQISPAAGALAIVNPLSAFGGGAMLGLFRSHPPTEERVARLDAMAGGA
jgi:heat shock protein HtpX